MMRNKIKEEKGITMVSLVIAVIMIFILTGMLIYNAQDGVHIKVLTNLYSDIDFLREKVSEYYNEYGKIPAEIRYNNITQLSSVLSVNNDIGNFYVIDLEAMQGITLNYGKDYEEIKNDTSNVDKYTDVYIINENSHNIFYVQGITINQDDTTKTYYTDYTEPDETTIDLRYIDGILIPDGYYYIGKYTDNSGNESIVISSNKDEQIDTTSETQYIWQKHISSLENVPGSITLSSEQNEDEFLKSVNYYKGYFKNKNKTTDIDVIYLALDEDKWSEVYTKNEKYIDKNGDVAYVPEGFRVSMSPAMNSIQNGLVSKDENDNEWVWIEVPKEITKNCTNDGEIEKTLKEYVSDYREDGYTDVWHDGCGFTEEQYNSNKSKMLQNIQTRGGFWISRYEAGIEGSDTDTSKARTSHTDITTSSPKAVSQQDMIPYNYVRCNEAQELASNMITSDEYTSGLMFGIQWDLICKFIEECSSLELEDINTDSTDWGNYSNSGFKITSLNAKQYDSSTWKSITGTKTSSGLLTSGASYQNKILNIYDLAGNQFEWTLEYIDNDSFPSISRGGRYSNSGSEFPAHSRVNNESGRSTVDFGFRIAIY